MGLDFFQRAVDVARKVARPGTQVEHTLQTNGVLIDEEWCRFLHQHGFLVGLSLDGPAELHDRYRVTGAGAGTHADVMRAFHRMRAAGVEFNVLAVVNAHTASHAKDIYAYFRDLGMRFMQFIPCIETDPETFRPHPFSVTPEAYGDFLCELFEAWLPEAMDGISIRLFDGLLRKALTGNSGLCYLDGACGECPVIEHNGDVYPCDFFVQPEQKLGNVMQTPLEKLILRGRARRFRSARHNLPEACAACAWKDFCRGGCLKDRQRIAGDFAAPSWFCETYRRFFPHALPRVEALAARVREREGASACGGGHSHREAGGRGRA
jgi:uncharacterized protein